MIIKCVTCGRKLRCEGVPRDARETDDYTLREVARAVLFDPGTPGDGTGGLYIMMPYVISMSAEAGPYCFDHTRERLNTLNRDK